MVWLHGKRDVWDSHDSQTRKLTRANSGYHMASKILESSTVSWDIPPTGDQVFKFRSLLGPFRLKLHEPPTESLSSCFQTCPSLYTLLYPPWLTKLCFPQTHASVTHASLNRSSLRLSPLWSLGELALSRLSWHSCLLPGYSPLLSLLTEVIRLSLQIMLSSWEWTRPLHLHFSIIRALNI